MIYFKQGDPHYGHFVSNKLHSFFSITFWCSRTNFRFNFYFTRIFPFFWLPLRFLLSPENFRAQSHFSSAEFIHPNTWVPDKSVRAAQNARLSIQIRPKVGKLNYAANRKLLLLSVRFIKLMFVFSSFFLSFLCSPTGWSVLWSLLLRKCDEISPRVGISCKQVRSELRKQFRFVYFRSINLCFYWLKYKSILYHWCGWRRFNQVVMIWLG